MGVDFKRVKSKVGRKLKKVNETKTDFKAKSINLPSQNLKTNAASTSGAGADGDGDIVLTRRMVSMSTLISQCRHYNQKVRANAVQGILEILQAHDVSRTGSSLSQVLQSVLESLADASAKVRKTALSVLRALFKREAKVKPFVPLLLVHIFKAMTHLSPEVSTDGIEALSIMLKDLAEAISEQNEDFFRRLRENFNAILSQLFMEATNVEARCKFVSKLLVCIESALGISRRRGAGGRAGGARPDAMAAVGDPPLSHASTTSVLTEDWRAALHRKFPQEYQAFMVTVGGHTDVREIHREETILFNNLRKLMNMFRIHFRSDHKEVQKERQLKDYFEITSRVTSCLFLILDTRSDLDKETIGRVMDETAQLFPVREEDQSLSKRREDILEYNISCINLMLSCVDCLAATTARGEEEGFGGNGTHRSFEDVAERTWAFAATKLERMSKACFADAADSRAPSGEAERFRALVSCCVRMLKWVRPETREKVAESLCALFSESKDPAVKKVLIQAAFTGQESLLDHCSPEDFVRWVFLIPKMIWEGHNAKDAETCSLGSKVLLKLVQCASALDSEQRESLQLQLLPIFAIPTGKGTIWGPYVRLDSSFQLDMTSILHYTAPISVKLQKSLAMCALNSGLDEGVCTKLLYVMTCEWKEGSADHLKSLSTLILGSCHKQSIRAETVKSHAAMTIRTRFGDTEMALITLGKEIFSDLGKPSVPMLWSLVGIFDRVLREEHFSEEGFSDACRDLVSAPATFVALKWATCEVRNEKPNKHSPCLGAIWSVLKKAKHVLSSFVSALGDYMESGGLSLPQSGTALMETANSVERGCAITTVLYETIKKNLVYDVAAREALRGCLRAIEASGGETSEDAKYVYLKKWVS